MADPKTFKRVAGWRPFAYTLFAIQEAIRKFVKLTPLCWLGFSEFPVGGLPAKSKRTSGSLKFMSFLNGAGFLRCSLGPKSGRTGVGGGFVYRGNRTLESRETTLHSCGPACVWKHLFPGPLCVQGRRCFWQPCGMDSWLLKIRRHVFWSQTFFPPLCVVQFPHRRPSCSCGSLPGAAFKQRGWQRKHVCGMG